MVAPTLMSTMSSIKGHDYPPLLQAAILAKPPRNIIVDIIERFDCTMIRDSSHLLPVNVAIDEKLSWEAGLKEVFEATAAKQQRSVLYTAAYYGLQWINHMQELVETEMEDNTGGVADESKSEKGLHNIVIIATMGNHNDLDTIYSLLKMTPDILGSHRNIE